MQCFVCINGSRRFFFATQKSVFGSVPSPALTFAFSHRAADRDAGHSKVCVAALPFPFAAAHNAASDVTCLCHMSSSLYFFPCTLAYATPFQKWERVPVAANRSIFIPLHQSSPVSTFEISKGREILTIIFFPPSGVWSICGFHPRKSRYQLHIFLSKLHFANFFPHKYRSKGFLNMTMVDFFWITWVFNLF